MNLDLKHLLGVARRRWWLVLIMMIVAGSAAYVSASRETKLYSASATMLVNPGQSFTGAIDYNSLQVMETYPQLITTGDMLQRVADALGLEQVPGGISASVINGSQMIEISVVDTDAERSALVANTMVSEFRGYVADQAASRAEDARSGLEAQIAALEERLEEIDTRIEAIDTEDTQEDRTIQREIEDLSQERVSINASLTQLNTQSATIGAQIIAASPRVELAGSAVAPRQPFEPQPRRDAVLGVMMGLMLAVGVVALLEYLNNAIRPDSDVQEIIGAPLLATIPRVAKLEPGGRQVFVTSQTNSTAAEAVRLLRTNLEFASATSDVRSITVTSPGPGEGKSTTAANLATVMAQAGLRTVLIDADLRRPTQASIFSVSSGSGLTTLLVRADTEWRDVARETSIAGLMLIPSGPLPPNPADLAGSQRLRTVLAEILADADRVIIDSPPILAASDALAIAAHTDGVVLVAHSSKTRIEAVRHATQAVRQGGIRLIGLVLNRQKGQAGAAEYGGYYQASSTSTTARQSRPSMVRRSTDRGASATQIPTGRRLTIRPRTSTDPH